MLNHVNLMEKIVTLMEKIDTPTNYWRGVLYFEQCVCRVKHNTMQGTSTHYKRFHNIINIGQKKRGQKVPWLVSLLKFTTYII